ncbi:MAG: hypothetical protein GF388_05055, partial [Candidatus Aegiribacteria sp.]|nr:hypothetical protein [Candidatus Aegiribacteria sp.]MBD3294587.1 hypothetical protein [Candidatus Fermentibacteria bacterium]
MFGKTATRRWVRAVVIGLVLFLLSFYLLLITGFFGQGLGAIVSAIVSNDSVTVAFSGLRSDVFWTTAADTVTVSTRDGLLVEVSEVRITGSLITYLMFARTEGVSVERLEIDLPPTKPEMEGDEPDSLSVILDNIASGIAVGTDELSMNYGVIRDTSGTVLDSMYIVTSVDRTFGIVLDVDSVAVDLPDLGRIGGHGVLSMVDLEVSTDAFHATLPFGTAELSGKLSGPREYLDAYLSGSAETGSFDLPLNLSCDFQGHLYGLLSDLDADLSILNGQTLLFGTEADFRVDTIMADLDQVTVRGLQATTEHARVDLDGEFGPSSLEWNTLFRLDMNGMDLSLYSESAPEVDLNGSVTGDIQGNGAALNGGWARIVLNSSTSEYMDITSMDLQASVQGSALGIDGTLETDGGEITVQGEGHLDMGFIPNSWTVQLSGYVHDFNDLVEYLPPGIPQAGSLDFSLKGSGTHFGMGMQGYIRLEQLESDFARADAVAFSGNMNWTSPNLVSSTSPELSLEGTATLEGLSADGVEADSASLDGTFSVVRGESSAEAAMLVDSLRFASDAFHVTSDVTLEGSNLNVENLALQGSRDRIYSAEAQVVMGDTTFLDVIDLRASHSKLRVVTDGVVSAYATEGLVVIDTLWIDPPVGDLSMSGELGSNVSRINANIYNIDLSSFSTFSGLPADMSGTGNFTLSWNSDSSGAYGSLAGEIS